MHTATIRTSDDKGTLAFTASDVTGQRSFVVQDAPLDASIGEVLQSIVARLELPPFDAERRAFTYHVRLDREERHLLHSERVGDALESGDQVVIEPNVDAGA